MSSPPARKPWPMKWIVLAILLCIIPYTYINLRYRKTGPAFQPYEDMKNRANVIRLLNAGYRRIPLPAEVPADPLKDQSSAMMRSLPGGLPTELGSTLAELPALPTDITRVVAPAMASSQSPYSFRLACTLPDEKRMLAGAELYLKGNQLVVTPDFEKLSANCSRARGTTSFSSPSRQTRSHPAATKSWWPDRSHHAAGRLKCADGQRVATASHCPQIGARDPRFKVPTPPRPPRW